jgi:hypothetical protein
LLRGEISSKQYVRAVRTQIRADRETGSSSNGRGSSAGEASAG